MRDIAGNGTERPLALAPKQVRSLTLRWSISRPPMRSALRFRPLS